METLTNEQILEGNKLLAEFMGKKIITDGISWFDTYYNALPRYDLSWDSLMPVVEKIESILPNDNVVTIHYKDCIIPVAQDEFDVCMCAETKIQAVWLACVDFAKWHKAQI